MSKKKLKERVNEILWEVWDPIGINSAGGPEDEYRSYVPHLVKLLEQGADPVKIAQHLHQLATVSMGLSSDLEDHKAVAQRLRKLVE